MSKSLYFLLFSKSTVCSFFPFSALIVRSGICQKKKVLGIVLFIVQKDLTFPESSFSFPTITFRRVVFPQPTTQRE
jgi:hypothetical protein